MKPRRLDSETIVSRSETAGATSSGATSLGSVVGRVTGRRPPKGHPDLAWPDARTGETMLAERSRSPAERGLTADVRGVLFGRSTDIGRSTEDLGYPGATALEVRRGVRDRGATAGGLHLQRAVPVLGRRGPRLQDL